MHFRRKSKNKTTQETTTKLKDNAPTPTEKKSEKIKEAATTEKKSTKIKTKKPKKDKSSEAKSAFNSFLSYEVLLVLIITIVAASTRFYRLGEPNEVVFDEVHFGGFMVNYLNGAYFFDIHPPLGKLILAAAGWVVDMSNYSRPQWETIGKVYPDDKYLAPRAVSAVFGSLLAPLAFLISREMGRSSSASLLVSALVIADGTLLVSSRFILTDALLWFFGALTLYTGLRLWRVEAENPTANPFKLRSWWLWTVATGLSMGCVVSVKWTGLGYVATVGIAQLLRTLYHLCSYFKDSKASTATTRLKHKRLFIASFSAGAMMVTLMAVVYLFVWILHFNILVNTGPGAAWHGPTFLASLSGSGHTLKPGVEPYTMLQKIVEIHQKMFEANKNLAAGHAYGSPWHGWPLMEKPIAYWMKHQKTVKSEVKLDGNAAVYAASTLAVLFFGAYAFTTWTRWDDESLDKRQRRFCVWGSWLLFGYAINLLPYVLVTRVCFLYHYVPSLYFAILLVGLVVDKYFSWGRIEKGTLVGILLLFSAFFFVRQAPAYYAQNVPLH